MGVFAAFLSAFFAAAKDLMSKKLAFHIDGMTSTFASFAFPLPFYLLALALLVPLGIETVELAPAFLLLVFLRSVTDSFAEGMKMYAFNHGDISVIASFLSLSPLFQLFLTPFITGDVPTPGGIVAVVLVVAGSLVLMYRPSSEGWAIQKKGITFAVGASLFFSLNNCFDRLAVQERDATPSPVAALLVAPRGTPTYAAFAMTLMSAVLIAPFALTRRDRLAAMRVSWFGLTVRGGLELPFMVAKLYALQTWQPAYVAGVQRLSLLLSIVGGRLFFKEQDFGRRLAAGALILAGVVWLVWLETRKAGAGP